MGYCLNKCNLAILGMIWHNLLITSFPINAMANTLLFIEYSITI